MDPRREAPLERAYAPPGDVFDEMKDPRGEVRPQWQNLLDHLHTIGATEVGQRWEKAQHLLHENGVSYNAYADPQGLERPWTLSFLPVLLSPEDWAGLSRGLKQRGRLLELLLADLHGPQRTLMEGRLPPELVYTHPSFLRAVHGMSVPRDQWLPLYSADLLRAADGRFYVMEDGTQAPSGAGYALENRIVVSRMLPESFRESNVERLAPFFRTLRETLHALAPHNRDNPRIVLLTPGPYNATYFEQAYLAQYLGFTLVNGTDLTVRDDRVWLKTLSGLQAVDVILRRVNDDFCDPLELRPESMLGVPGLVQAARMGHVAVASPLGSGLAQTTALLPYLPGVCKLLLGEDLALPSVKTWWCGDEAAMAEVMTRIDDVVIKSTFPGGDEPHTHTATLSRAERDALISKMRARPSAYVAQENVAPSTTPGLVGDALCPLPLVLRFYGVAPRTGDFTLMPGGLARVAEAISDTEVSMQRGARSKDVWVLSREAVSDFSLLHPPQRAVELSRGGSDLPSRVADDLYWLGRYAERAEGVARLARAIGLRLCDLSNEDDLRRSHEFGALLSALHAQTMSLSAIDIPREEVKSLADCEARVLDAVLDLGCHGSVASVVKSMVRIARVVRDRISADTWRVLASIDGELSPVDTSRGLESLSTAVNALSRIVVTLAGFSGLVMESMTRGQGWHFLDMGRRIERAVTVVTLLRSTTTVRNDREGPLLETVLDIADSGMTYRRRYLATLQAAPVVDLLLADETNPRSVVYQLRALGDDIRALPLLPGAGPRNPLLRRVLTILNELELADVEALCIPDTAGDRPALDATLRRVGTLLPALSESISNSYLNHSALSRHLRQGDTRRLSVPPDGTPR